MHELRTLACLIGLSLALVASASGAPTNLERPALKIAVGGRSLVAYLPLTIAERRGFFAREGLQVELNDVAGGAKALEALVGGSVDVVCGAYEHTIFMAAKGIKLRAIALQNNSYGLVIGLPPAKAASYTSPRDLKGLTVGVTAPGSSSSLGLRLLLAKAGLTANDVAIVGVGGGAAAVAAMKSGRLDAMANFDPVISLLERDGALKPILDTRLQRDLDELYGGPFAASAFYVSADFVARYPNTTQAFANAVSTALKWIATASTDDIVAAVPPEYYAGDRALYHLVIERNRPQFSRDGRITLAAAKNVFRILSTFEETLKGADIDLSQTFDDTFIDRADQSGPR